ncbi:MAG: AAA family ATPase, partial [Proteobacteria bacterium]|nr:AAA family ATPase [Pseudomonadota bacterium]
EIGQVQDQNINISAQIKSAMTALEQEQSASQTVKDRLAILNQELETCKAHVMDLVAKEAQYKNFYQNATNNKQSLKRRLNRIAEEEVKTKTAVSELQQTSAKTEADYKNCKAEINALNQQIADIKNRLEIKNNSLAQQVKQVQILELERNKAKSTYAALKKMDDNFEWYKDGVRSIMKKARSESGKDPAGTIDPAQNEDILGLMADIVEPEDSFETAVEAVLGESLQYILVRDQQTGIGSIDYLQTSRSGRSGFIPVSSVKSFAINPPKTSGPSPKLLSHVSVKPGFEKIAEALLGHVLIAENIEEAVKIHNYNGATQTIVTKDGAVISHQGVLIGGSPDNLSGILTKKQELKKLDLRINKLNQKLESARRELKELEVEVREIETNLQKLIEQKNKVTQLEIEAEKALYKTTEDLKHARRHLEIIQLEQDQLQGEEIDIEEQMARYHQAIADIEKNVQAAQKQATEKLEQIGAVTSKSEEFNQKIVDLKLKLTALNAKLENSNNTLKRLKDFQNDGLKRLEQLCLEIAQKKHKQSDAKQKVLESEHIISVMHNDLAHLEQTLDRNQADFHAIDATLKDNDSIVSDIQNKRETTLQKIRLLEIEQSQRQIQRENIANRLMENYHASIAALRSEHAPMPDTPEKTIAQMENELDVYRKRIAIIDDVNLGAIKEYEQLKERFDFLCEQRDDLVKAVDDLHKVIKKINKITQERFLTTFDAINQKLDEVFPRLFEGGSAKLVLTEPDKPLDTGVEYMIHPPGKKLTRMSLLSGGEKALSAIALIFSIFLIKPATFCLMDEIDANLDELNIFRFNELLKIIGEKSQIIMVTHNKKSMEFAETLFGITMEKKGVSKVVSVDFERKN